MSFKMEVDYEILGIKVSKELYDNIKQEVEKFGGVDLDNIEEK